MDDHDFISLTFFILLVCIGIFSGVQFFIRQAFNAQKQQQLNIYQTGHIKHFDAQNEQQLNIAQPGHIIHSEQMRVIRDNQELLMETRKQQLLDMQRR